MCSDSCKHAGVASDHQSIIFIEVMHMSKVKSTEDRTVIDRQPTGIQIDALRRYAQEEGRYWKLRLLDDWTNGRTVGPLQEVRNQLGPSWLLKHGAKVVR